MNKPSLCINNQWQPGQGEIFSSEDPCTGEIIWQGQTATQQDVSNAVEAARNAFPKWSLLSFAQRVEHIKQYQAALTEQRDVIARTISQETGKPLWESQTEVGAMIGKIDISIDAWNTRTGETRKDNGAVTSAVCHKPHGVVAVLGPFNFPGHLPNGHIVPALLAGNTLVFKPSELTPLVAAKMMECWQQAQLPSGVLNLIQGAGDTGRWLSQHTDINGLFFTGSHTTGRLLHQQFAGQVDKILALELGGNNPLIIDEVQDIKAAVYHTLHSAYITAGQRCTCARRLVVIRNNHSDEYINQLSHAIDKIIVDAPENTPTPFMGPVISNAAADITLKTQSHLIEQGGKVINAVKRLQTNKPFLSPGLIDVTGLTSLPDTECFGPLLQLIVVDDLQQAIHTANQTQFGLAAGIFTDNSAHWKLFYANSRAGIVNWNRPLTGASSSAPFGGVGASGNHRPSAYYAADYCAWPVASLEETTLQLPSELSAGIRL